MLQHCCLGGCCRLVSLQLWQRPRRGYLYCAMAAAPSGIAVDVRCRLWTTALAEGTMVLRWLARGCACRHVTLSLPPHRCSLCVAHLWLATSLGPRNRS